jgi:hypothetical protein
LIAEDIIIILPALSFQKFRWLAVLCSIRLLDAFVDGHVYSFDLPDDEFSSIDRIKCDGCLCFLHNRTAAALRYDG